jgi:PAS domain S-box-containing protein
MTEGEGDAEPDVGYRAVLDGVSDLVVLVDPDGSVAYANAAAERLLGVAPETLVGEPLVSYVHDADADAVEQLLSAPAPASAADDGPRSVEACARSAGEGDRRWLAFVRTARQPASSDAVVVTVRDVTEQRRVTERFRHLVETASDLLVLLDGDGVLQYATPAAGRVLGYDHGELVGENVLAYTHPDDRERVLDALRRGLDDPGYTATVEHRFRTKSGEWRWLESRARCLSEDLALEGRIVVVTRDVTDRRRREGRITAQNERLERFAATVSHDLQTPLSVASGSLELYRRTGDETSLARVDRALQRMSELTSDLLGLAREGGRVEDPAPVDLSVVAAAALETSPLPADDVAVHPNLPTVQGSEVRVRSLFENLFRNVADHAGPDARVWVDPLADSRDDDSGDGGDVVGFAVEDDGPGIAADDAESVFELGTSSDHDGTGIGLHVVDTIASAHGWDVSVTAGRHEGARFEFRGVDVASTADADGADEEVNADDAA